MMFGCKGLNQAINEVSWRFDFYAAIPGRAKTGTTVSLHPASVIFANVLLLSELSADF